MSENLTAGFEIDRKINDLDKELLQNLRNPQLDMDKVRKLCDDFLNTSSHPEHDYFTAMLLAFFYPDILNTVQLAWLHKMITASQTASPAVQKLFNAMDRVDHEVETYFVNQPKENRLIMTNQLPDQLACALLNIKCDLKVKEMRESFQKKGQRHFIIETFQDPQTSMWQIWMSTQGVHFIP